jgi:hypothetical protein
MEDPLPLFLRSHCYSTSCFASLFFVSCCSPPKRLRSPLLTFHLLDLKFPELDQMVGQIYALSKYQQGCRFLQKKLDDKNPSNTRIILNELLNHLVELMTGV